MIEPYYKHYITAFKILIIASVVAIGFIAFKKISNVSDNSKLTTFSDHDQSYKSSYGLVVEDFTVYGMTDSDLPYKISARSGIKIGENEYDLKIVNADYATTGHLAMLKSNKALISQKKFFNLSGNVWLELDEIKCNTDSIRLDPNTSEVYGDQPISINYKDSVIHASGIEGNLESGRVILRGRVRAFIPAN